MGISISRRFLGIDEMIWKYLKMLNWDASIIPLLAIAIIIVIGLSFYFWQF